MAETRTTLLMSRQNLSWVGAALAMLAIHLVLKQHHPDFVPPASMDKQKWIRTSLYVEFFIHLAYLAALFSAVRNSIPALRNPRYGDEEVLSLDSSAPLEDVSIRWGNILIVVTEFLVYLTLWAWCYGII